MISMIFQSRASEPLRYRIPRVVGRAALYLVLCTGTVLMMVPLAWMVSTSLKESTAVFAFPPVWIPDPFAWGNYRDLFVQAPFARFYFNTIVITVFAVIGQVLSASLVGFSFARLRFPGRDVLFVILLATMLLPEIVTMIPLYILFRSIGWVDTFLPLIVPHYFGLPFYIFLMRQFMMQQPIEIYDAAKIDGCSYFGLYWRIAMPLAAPAMGIVAVFTFIYTWQDFLGPLIYLPSYENFTLSLGLNWFKAQYTTDWNLLMAGSLLTMAPCLLVFFLAQRYFIQGIVFSGVKG